MNVQDTTHNEMSLFPTLVGRRLTVLDLFLQYRFDAYSIAILAEIPEAIVTQILSYQPVHLDDATRVLTILSQLLHQNYTLDNLDVPLLQEQEEGLGKQDS